MSEMIYVLVNTEPTPKCCTKETATACYRSKGHSMSERCFNCPGIAESDEYRRAGEHMIERDFKGLLTCSTIMKEMEEMYGQPVRMFQ